MCEDALTSKLASIFIEVLTFRRLEVIVHAGLRLSHKLVAWNRALLGVWLDIGRVLRQRLNQGYLHQLCLVVPSPHEQSDTSPLEDTPPLIENILLFCQYRQSEVLYLVFSIHE